MSYIAVANLLGWDLKPYHLQSKTASYTGNQLVANPLPDGRGRRIEGEQAIADSRERRSDERIRNNVARFLDHCPRQDGSQELRQDGGQHVDARQQRACALDGLKVDGNEVGCQEDGREQGRLGQGG